MNDQNLPLEDDEFDDDGNGTLDLKETKTFVRNTLVEMDEKPDYTPSKLALICKCTSK